MSRRFQETLRTGWYYRVLQEGMIHAHDSLQLEQRDNSDWPLSRVLEVLYQRPLELESLRGMASLTTLSPNLIQLAKNRRPPAESETCRRRCLAPPGGGESFHGSAGRWVTGNSASPPDWWFR